MGTYCGNNWLHLCISAINICFICTGSGLHLLRKTTWQASDNISNYLVSWAISISISISIKVKDTKIISSSFPCEMILSYFSRESIMHWKSQCQCHCCNSRATLPVLKGGGHLKLGGGVQYKIYPKGYCFNIHNKTHDVNYYKLITTFVGIIHHILSIVSVNIKREDNKSLSQNKCAKTYLNWKKVVS